MLGKLERQPLATQAASSLRALITNGEYVTGDRLPTEPELGKLLGVGRSTVREAVHALAHVGLLEVRQGSGTYVREASADSETLNARLCRAQIGEVHEARRVLEVEIAALAAQRRTAGDLATMRSALDTREALRTNGEPNLNAFLDADLAFHNAIAAASGNAILRDLYASFLVVVRDSLMSLNVDVPAARSETRKANQAVLHEHLYDAIAAQDSEQAREVVTELLGDIVDSLEFSPEL